MCAMSVYSDGMPHFAGAYAQVKKKPKRGTNTSDAKNNASKDVYVNIPSPQSKRATNTSDAKNNASKDAYVNVPSPNSKRGANTSDAKNNASKDVYVNVPSPQSKRATNTSDAKNNVSKDAYVNVPSPNSKRATNTSAAKNNASKDFYVNVPCPRNDYELAGPFGGLQDEYKQDESYVPSADYNTLHETRRDRNLDLNYRHIGAADLTGDLYNTTEPAPHGRTDNENYSHIRGAQFEDENMYNHTDGRLDVHVQFDPEYSHIGIA